MKVMRCEGFDSSHSWILVAAGTLVMLTTYGSFVGSSGVLYKAYIDVRHVSEEDASWPSSIHSGMAIVAGPATALLSSRLSNRSASILALLLNVLGSCACFFSTDVLYVCIFYGAVSGLGGNISCILIPALISRSFQKYRVTAMSLVLMGIPIGSLIFPLITSALLERYGLNGTFLILGATSMQGIVASALLVDVKAKQHEDISFNRGNIKINENAETTVMDPVAASEVSTQQYTNVRKISSNGKPNEPKSQTNIVAVTKMQETEKAQKANTLIQHLLSLSKRRGFHLCNFVQCSSFLLTFLFTLVILDYTTKKDISYNKSIILLTTYSLGQIAGRFVLGWISDRNLIPKTLYMFMGYGILAVLCVTLPFIFQYELLILNTVLYSVLLGNLVPIAYALFADYIPKGDIVLAYSVCRTFGGIVSILRSTVIRVFSGGSRSYDQLFIFLGTLSFVTSFAMLAEFFWNKRKLNENKV